MKKILVFIVILALLYGCAAPSKEVPLEEKQAEAEPKAAENAETQAPAAPAEEVKTEEIPAELNDMLTKSKTKLTSYSYNHKSPQKTEATKIYVKGSKIKIIPTSVVNLDGKFYNTIYLDTESKKAEAYCVGYSNCGNNLGKITDLDYGKAYIETPADWLAKVKVAGCLGAVGLAAKVHMVKVHFQN